jgi:hypothetical protein
MCNTDPIKTQTILWKTGFTKGGHMSGTVKEGS